jgi:hypothetical protein
VLTHQVAVAHLPIAVAAAAPHLAAVCSWPAAAAQRQERGARQKDSRAHVRVRGAIEARDCRCCQCHPRTHAHHGTLQPRESAARAEGSADC